jgi:hypothetical protein
MNDLAVATATILSQKRILFNEQSRTLTQCVSTPFGDISVFCKIVENSPTRAKRVLSVFWFTNEVGESVSRCQSHNTSTDNNMPETSSNRHVARVIAPGVDASTGLQKTWFPFLSFASRQPPPLLSSHIPNLLLLHKMAAVRASFHFPHCL